MQHPAIVGLIDNLEELAQMVRHIFIEHLLLGGLIYGSIKGIIAGIQKTEH